MKVALYVGNQLPEQGGSYTFESQIIEYILKLAPESNHTFVLYTWNQKASDSTLFSDIETVSIYDLFMEVVKPKISRTAKAIFRKIKDPRSQFKIEGWDEKYIVDSLTINQVKLTLCLSPGAITLDHPYIATVWDLQHRLQSYFPEVSVDGEWERREQSYAKLLRRATFIITGTEVGKSEIEKFYQVPKERIKVIPFFTPKFKLLSNLTDIEVMCKYNLPSRYLFYPAQFWPHKNHVSLLLAIKLLKEKYDLHFPLVFAGSDKGNESYVREIVEELDLSKHVYFLGFIPQEDMPYLYRNAFALTFMTFFGPDNLPPLEAMALECPVVASNVSGAKEQLGDAALLVDPKQPEEIAFAIKSLLEDTIRQNLIKLGLERASQWTVKDYVSEIFSVIDDFEAIRHCWR